jgi:UDP-glucose 4-epimerase
MKKVLITGGAGFIGSHTADLLIKQNVSVRVLDNLSSGHRGNLPDSHPLLEFIEGDITDSDIVDKAMTGISRCLHLAAQVSVVASLEDPELSARQNIIGFINVLSAVHRHSVDKLVFASSATIYGEPDEIPLTELATQLPLSPYGLEKQVDETYAELYSRLYQQATLGLRYFNVFGPRQDPKSPYAGVIALFVEQASKNGCITVHGDGSQSRDFIYVDDVACANLAALNSDLTGVCNIGSGTQTSILELINTLSEVAEKQCELNFIDNRDGDIRHSLAHTGKMNDQLGIEANTSLSEGLTTLINHTAKQHNKK